MKIKKNSNVTLIYLLRCDGEAGEVVEQITESDPLEFTYGKDEILDAFEEKLEGLEEGSDFNFLLNHVEAYGEFSADAIVDLPLDIFMVNGKLDKNMLEIGNEVPMKDDDGNEYDGVILEVGDSYVRVDFNHPLAGKDLYFTGKILSVK
ncbi:MAG: peptidylprolyl isomerase [Marinilabiliales bacterium]|nr:MAG: peptidylprolyl isomerase [Marinilabiliales bacterium]